MTGVNPCARAASTAAPNPGASVSSRPNAHLGPGGERVEPPERARRTGALDAQRRADLPARLPLEQRLPDRDVEGGVVGEAGADEGELHARDATRPPREALSSAARVVRLALLDEGVHALLEVAARAQEAVGEPFDLEAAAERRLVGVV